MDTFETQLHFNQQAVVDRYVAACQADNRIVAAFIGGSFARDAADQYSDLDLYLITTDDDFEAFCAQRDAFLQLLGEPQFIEDFDIPNIVFIIFTDGTECELGFGCESRFNHIHNGPYRILLDKKRLLAGVVFPNREPNTAEQIEKLRRLIYWFWHDISHFITAIGRGQLWWAQDQLEELRRYCVNLARLRNNFSDMGAGDETYFKLEKAMPVEQLSALQATFCPMNEAEMLKAAAAIVCFYKGVAIPLAKAHQIFYPAALEDIMVRRMLSHSGAAGVVLLEDLG